MSELRYNDDTVELFHEQSKSNQVVRYSAEWWLQWLQSAKDLPAGTGGTSSFNTGNTGGNSYRPWNFDLPTVTNNGSLHDSERLAAIERAREILANMPEGKRLMLLAPMEHGLLALQSTLFLNHPGNEEGTTVRVEDVLQLISDSFASIKGEHFIAQTYTGTK